MTLIKMHEPITVNGFFDSTFTLQTAAEADNSAPNYITIEGNQFPSTEYMPIGSDGFELTIFGNVEINEFLDAMARLLEKHSPGALLKIITNGEPLPDQSVPVNFEEVKDFPFKLFPHLVNQLPKRPEGINQNE